MNLSGIKPKDHRELIARAQAQGWCVAMTRGDHVRLTAPDGHGTVIASLTASDRRATQETRALLRRYGYREVA